MTPEDVIRELGIKTYELRKNEKKFDSLSTEEKKIVEIIENEPMAFDEIVRSLKLDSSRLATLLSMMEIRGIIKNSGGSYSVK